MKVSDSVLAAQRRADEFGFEFACDDGTGRLLSVLAAAVPQGGRILEIGTGVGVGCAWIVHGLGPRTDVEVHSVELDDACAKAAAAAAWPDYVTLHHGDALQLLPELGTFDLIFPDAPAGKWTGLDTTVAALRPHGLLIVDDLMYRPGFRDDWTRALERTRTTLLAHADLLCAEIADLTGVILCSKKAGN